MNLQNFKYVSFSFGGYNDIHSFAMEHKIDLLEHGKECILCKVKENMKQKKSFSDVLMFWKGS